jgi:hypothetical protein
VKRSYWVALILVVAVAVLVPAGLMASRMWAAKPNAELGEIRAYYLPGNDKCTVLVDFAARRSHLTSMDSESRLAHLADQMIREFRRSGDTEAKGATTIQMIAVYIEGKDNYNRPDFGKRVNLLKLSGTAAQFRSLSDAEASDWNRVKSILHAEVQ